jgi:hypothetical protein
MSKSPRPIRIEGDVAYIPLTKGYEAVIDAADVPLVSAWSWSADEDTRPDGTVRAVYARRHGRSGSKKYTVSLHRQILALGPGLEGEHRDGDGLNNRRSNLRVATRSQNACNRGPMPGSKSGVKGVYWQKSVRKWRADINLSGQVHYLGLFRCITAAALAYAKASRGLHGDFGRLA